MPHAFSDGLALESAEVLILLIDGTRAEDAKIPKIEDADPLTAADTGGMDPEAPLLLVG